MSKEIPGWLLLVIWVELFAIHLSFIRRAITEFVAGGAVVFSGVTTRDMHNIPFRELAGRPWRK